VFSLDCAERCIAAAFGIIAFFASTSTSTSTFNARVTDPSLILFYTLPAQVRCLVHSPPHLVAQLTLTRSHWHSYSHSRLSHEPISDEPPSTSR
jgi:hypothetical protein